MFVVSCSVTRNANMPEGQVNGIVDILAKCLILGLSEFEVATASSDDVDQLRQGN